MVENSNRAPTYDSQSQVYLTQLHNYHSVICYFIYNLIYVEVIQELKAKAPTLIFQIQVTM